MKLLIPIILGLSFCMAACDDKQQGQSFKTLFEAAQHGDAHGIKRLISNGNELDRVDVHGRTALAYAVMGHHLDAVKLLIASGANKAVITTRGYDLVMLSLYNEMDPSLDMLNYLVDIGLGVNRITADGDSALNIAISSQHEKAVARLLFLGALPNEESDDILANQLQPNAAIIRLVNEVKSKRKSTS